MRQETHLFSERGTPSVGERWEFFHDRFIDCFVYRTLELYPLVYRESSRQSDVPKIFDIFSHVTLDVLYRLVYLLRSRYLGTV